MGLSGRRAHGLFGVLVVMLGAGVSSQSHGKDGEKALRKTKLVLP